MMFVDDQDPVKQFTAQGSDHPFTDGVCSGSSGWTGEDPDAIGGEDRVKRAGEPGIPVSEQKRHGDGSVTEVHQQVAGV